MEDISKVDTSQRRKPSSRRQRGVGGGLSSSLSHSLTRDRRGGLASTKGQLSQSFIDQKGLGAAMIGDILSAGADFDDDDLTNNNTKGDDGPKDRQKTMEELLGVGPPSDDEDNDGKTERKISFDESGGTSNSALRSPRSSLKSSINRRRGLKTIESQRVLE